MPQKPVPAAVVTELQRQLNHELGAAHAYLAMATWCESENRKGFASYFKKQAAEERMHAEKMMAHLLDRGVLPELTALQAPRTKFETMLQIANHAADMERANSEGINKCYEAALEAKDYPAQILLQWFISEQVEEEAWCAEMIERVTTSSCAGAIGELDRHIERYLADKVIGDAEAE